MIKNLDKTRQGELFIFSAVFIWSFFPVITILSFNSILPLFSAAFSTLAAAVFFAIIITIHGQWNQIKIKSAWANIFFATLFIGIIYYALLFVGISKTTAGNTSIINLSQVFFSMLILRIWGKELLNKKHIMGAVLIVIGAFIILFQGSLEVNIGLLIILIANMFTPIGNYFQQKAREKVSSVFLMFFRSFLGGIFLLFLAFSLSDAPSLINFSNSLIFILINGFILMGLSKIFFIESIHRIPITKSLALGAIGPAFTIIIAFFVLKESPTVWQLLGFLPMFFGVLFLTNIHFRFKRLKEPHRNYLMHN